MQKSLQECLEKTKTYLSIGSCRKTQKSCWRVSIGRSVQVHHRRGQHTQLTRWWTGRKWQMQNLSRSIWMQRKRTSRSAGAPLARHLPCENLHRNTEALTNISEIIKLRVVSRRVWRWARGLRARSGINTWVRRPVSPLLIFPHMIKGRTYTDNHLHLPTRLKPQLEHWPRKSPTNLSSPLHPRDPRTRMESPTFWRKSLICSRTYTRRQSKSINSHLLSLLISRVIRCHWIGRCATNQTM